MSDYSKMKRSPEMTGWLRAPAAESFVKALADKRSQALTDLIGVAGMSTDPKVTRAQAKWAELESLVAYLGNARKEGRDEDE